MMFSGKERRMRMEGGGEDRGFGRRWLEGGVETKRYRRVSLPVKANDGRKVHQTLELERYVHRQKQGVEGGWVRQWVWLDRGGKERERGGPEAADRVQIRKGGQGDPRI